METNIRLPHDFYESLYEEIMNHEFNPENEDDTSCSMEIEIGKFTINLTATFEVHVVDNSFDHAFGTEYIYDLEAGDLEEIEIEDIWFYDEETDVEAELTEQFDEKHFWEQFKQYAIKRNGIYIHYGDEVVVKHSMTCRSVHTFHSLEVHQQERIQVHTPCHHRCSVNRRQE